MIWPATDEVKQRGKTPEKWEEIHKEESTAAQRGPWEGQRHRQGGEGGWKPHAGHLNSKAEQEQFNASASMGTFLNCLVKSVVRKALSPSSITLQSGSSTPSPLKTGLFYLPSGHLLAAFTRVHKELKQEVAVGWSTPALPSGHYRRFSLPWQHPHNTEATLTVAFVLNSISSLILA